MSDSCLYFLDVDGMKMHCTPDGGKFFYDCESLLTYVAEKCGKDVADAFKADEVQKVYDILDTYSLLDYQELIDKYNSDKETGLHPVLELKRLREIEKAFEEIVGVYNKMYEIYY